LWTQCVVMVLAGAIVGAALLRGLAKESNDHEIGDIQAVYLASSL